MEIRSFTRAERVRLLQFVREALERDLAGAELPAPPPFPRLAETGSCFVTLKEAGELRGCIGNIEAFEPLGKICFEMRSTRRRVIRAFRRWKRKSCRLF
ncbi:MAG: AMMECR1 domain-containing protein [Lentisphaeria bacterium]|nr:MAG: AMMECR1 domain-containing protein [Lentisphaeria bacterium]